MTLKFRPQSEPVGKYNYRIKSFNWCERKTIENHIQRVASQLHYLASHAPSKVVVKWQPIAHRFFKKYKKL